MRSDDVSGVCDRARAWVSADRGLLLLLDPTCDAPRRPELPA